MKPGTKVLVLGAGMVGSVIARDLAGDEGTSVSSADASAEALGRLSALCKVKTIEADLSDPAKAKALSKGMDIVIGALPGRLGFRILQVMVESGRKYVDISFMPEDQLSLDAAARKSKAVVVVDCGVAPGISNMLVGWAAQNLDEVERAAIYVGGLAAHPKPPFNYKAPFSPSDVIEEYVRPARFVENGKTVEKPALTDVETLEFPGIGKLEAFNTDGLRSLLKTIPARHMVEKTMRYPGHADLMRVFRDAGFFGERPVSINGASVAPLDLTRNLFFPLWKFDDGEEDFTVLKVDVSGRRNGIAEKLSWTLVDRYDAATGESSMSRTTAFPAAIIARMIANGEFRRSGVFAPESLAREPGVFQRMIKELAARGVRIQKVWYGVESAKLPPSEPG